MDSFEQVAKLETAAVRELLARGRPEQRVWALWTLALRTSGGVGEAVTRDPDPGVRRTLAVVLASHGETDLLVALARHDPQIVVRESAMQLVTRLAVQGQVPADIVVEAARVDPGVRGAILAAIDRDAPPFLVEIAADLLRDGTPTEQADAFEALLRTGSAELARAARTWLAGLRDPRDALARMVRAVGEYAVASELATATVEIRRAALGVMHAPAWPTIEMLVGDDVELLVWIVRERGIDVPLAVLVRAALDGQLHPIASRLSEGLAVLDAPDTELRRLLPLLDRHYADWIAALASETTTMLPASTDDNDDYAKARAAARKQLETARRQILRLMAA